MENFMKNRNRKAFTPIELSIVLILIGLLTTGVIGVKPSLRRPLRSLLKMS
jgi:prepilin-type N-terminal cleavage/methylation domain-containing protein